MKIFTEFLLFFLHTRRIVFQALFEAFNTQSLSVKSTSLVARSTFTFYIFYSPHRFFHHPRATWSIKLAATSAPQSPFGCSSFADLLSAPYTDPADAGSLSEELDPFPELQLGNPQGVPTVDESAQSQQTVHHQQPPQPPPPPPPLPEDVQADSLRCVGCSPLRFQHLATLANANSRD